MTQRATTAAALRRATVALMAMGLLAGSLAGCSGQEPHRRTLAAPALSWPGGWPGQAFGGTGVVGPATWAAVLQAENARPGLPGWMIQRRRGTAPGLDAYADRVSVLPGETVGLYVNGSGPITVRALRMGWYGGVGARLVWSGSAVAHPQPAAVTISAPLADAGGIRATRTMTARWHPTTLLSTTGWPEGEYLIRIDNRTASRFVPLTVRSADAQGRVLLVAGTMTWQAYNRWGGRSLYQGDGDRFAARSFAVSYDRPYADEFGAGHFLPFDLPLDQIGEQHGLPLAWITDYDLARDPSILDGAAAIVFGGHAEYWTGPMWDAVLAAAGRGTNLAVFGANTAYWRVRLAGRALGVPGDRGRSGGLPRIIVGAKDAALDPLAKTDPGGATTRFRAVPHARHEELLTGLRYDCFPAAAAWTVSDPGWWGFAGAGLHAGESLPGVVGPESDRVYTLPDRPRPMEVVAYTRFSCRGRATAQTSAYWVAGSGAGVFTAGTMNWTCAAGHRCTIPRPRRAAAVLSRITANILAAFAHPRAGLTHPATDTVSRYWLPPGNTTGAA